MSTILLWWSVQPFSLVVALFCITLLTWIAWWRQRGVTLGGILAWAWFLVFLGVFFVVGGAQSLGGLDYLAYHAKNIYTPAEFHQALLMRWRNILLPTYGTWLPIWAMGLACVLGLDLFLKRLQTNQSR